MAIQRPSRYRRKEKVTRCFSAGGVSTKYQREQMNNLPPQRATLMKQSLIGRKVTPRKVFPFNVYSSVVPDVFTQLCNHDHCPVPRHLRPPGKKPQKSYQAPPSATSLLSVSLDLPLLDSLEERDQVGISRLASFTSYNVFQVHPCRSRGHGFTPVRSRVCSFVRTGHAVSNNSSSGNIRVAFTLGLF